MRRDERPISAVPRWCLALLLAAFAAQVGYVSSRPDPVAVASRIAPAPTYAVLRAFSFGDELTMAKILMIWLQAFDNQPGISVPFARLDYGRIQGWLQRILELDPRAQYPLLAAGRLYALVPDPVRQRQMLEFVYEQFLLAPNERWQWVAHAAILAKHRLKDLSLALKYAEGINAHVSADIPFWAKDMSFIILQEMGELEAAKILIGGLLQAGTITDENELRFLEGRLREIQSGLSDENSTQR